MQCSTTILNVCGLNSTHKCLEIVKTLLQKHPDLKAISGDCTAAEMAFENNYWDAFSFIQNFERDNNAITMPFCMWTCLHNVKNMSFNSLEEAMDSMTFKSLVETLNTSFVVGNILTPLHYALLFKKIEVATLMIQAGVDTAICNTAGCSLLHFAVYCRETAVIRLLLDVLNANDEQDMILAAIEFDNAVTVRTLLRFNVKLPSNLLVCVQTSPKTEHYLLALGCVFLYLRKD